MYVGFWSRKHYSLIGKENKIELKTDYMPRTILRGKGTSSLSTYVSCPSSTNVLTGRRKHECLPRECHVLFWYNDTHTYKQKEYVWIELLLYGTFWSHTTLLTQSEQKTNMH